MQSVEQSEAQTETTEYNFREDTVPCRPDAPTPTPTTRAGAADADGEATAAGDGTEEGVDSTDKLAASTRIKSRRSDMEKETTLKSRNDILGCTVRG
jgi:hypothetical protein